MKTIAYKSEKQGESFEWTPVWNIIKERECDPNPGQYSLRHPNGALHSDLRGYDYKTSLYDDAEEEGFNVLRVGNNVDTRVR